MRLKGLKKVLISVLDSKTWSSDWLIGDLRCQHKIVKFVSLRYWIFQVQFKNFKVNSSCMNLSVNCISWTRVESVVNRKKITVNIHLPRPLGFKGGPGARNWTVTGCSDTERPLDVTLAGIKVKWETVSAMAELGVLAVSGLPSQKVNIRHIFGAYSETTHSTLLTADFWRYN